MVSSKDVAKRAGVSQTTVSRVLNNPSVVRKKTIEKVNQTIKELGYRPNSVARSLVSNQTKTIALISGPLSNPFFMETTTAIVKYANEQGYRIHVHFENQSDLEETYAGIFETKVDGLILSSILYEDRMYEELKDLQIPIVMFNRRHKEPCNFIEIDNEEAGYLATKHLIDLGHKKISWVGSYLTMSTFRGRFMGYERALKEAGIPFDQDLIIIKEAGEQSYEAAYQRLIRMSDKITAVYASTDSIALFLLDRYISEGYQVPEDISLIGTDNVKLAGHASLQISTVGNRERENLGMIAVKKLFTMIEQEEIDDSAYQLTLPVHLIERGTTYFLKN
ncbi:LacI family DNA-binding transcriptional regulator [Bhargavaea beijingensis]|uniref:LacI family DNA-binding transcriptional regulator n=1 Tax=Bhargavaea beijingensis TaxID=426756 RepID=UPI002224BE2A|nr:LacI family DNA-binding transcriptional regulator [Bhargavaea beijingensis]MCW1927388.1 LacI family transcriptional regulator [Bhargavaea beijingensis]